VSAALLEVDGLTTVVDRAPEPVPVVRAVSFSVAPGEAVGLVGESGSGKSLTMLSVMGLLPTPPVRVVSGSVRFEGVDLARAPERARRRLRGTGLAMIYQDPVTSLNPVMRIGDQIDEALTAHGATDRVARTRTLEVLEQVGLPRAARAFPHELSGGQRQRAMIAMALAASPRLLIADEPTTALDVTIQQQILALVARLQRELELAVVWITHDLGVVARLVKRVLVMYAGRIVEEGPTARVFAAPEHPYTAGLLGSIPDLTDPERPPLRQIAGAPPGLDAVPSGCPFAPRCPQAIERCAAEDPPLTARAAGGRAACWVPPERWR
jgi:oligopeptide/dipeptide ABC transporter ATP-binding protein